MLAASRFRLAARGVRDRHSPRVQSRRKFTQLDSIMHNKYARNPDKLRAWDSTSHSERAPKREKKPAGGTTPPKPIP